MVFYVKSLAIYSYSYDPYIIHKILKLIKILLKVINKKKNFDPEEKFSSVQFSLVSFISALPHEQNMTKC